MRHNKGFNHLGRTSSHRKAMLSNMASSLIMHKRIVTTVAKAKALRSYVEPLITKSKVDSTHSRRVVFSYLQNKNSVTELFREVAVKVGDRPGGYTRILKTGSRQGDNAEMAIIELVDFFDHDVAKKAETKKKTTRRSGSTHKKAESSTTVENKVETPIETKKEGSPVKSKKEETPVEDKTETSTEETSEA